MAGKHNKGVLDQRRKRFKQEIKETLGFDRFKFKGAYDDE